MLSARWLPRLYTLDNMYNRETNSQQCLKLCKSNPKEFLRCFGKVGDTPETKEESKQWTLLYEPAPKKAKTFLSAGKLINTVFWNSQGELNIDYLEKS